MQLAMEKNKNDSFSSLKNMSSSLFLEHELRESYEFLSALGICVAYYLEKIVLFDILQVKRRKRRARVRKNFFCDFCVFCETHFSIAKIT